MTTAMSSSVCRLHVFVNGKEDPNIVKGSGHNHKKLTWHSEAHLEVIAKKHWYVLIILPFRIRLPIQEHGAWQSQQYRRWWRMREFDHTLRDPFLRSFCPIFWATSAGGLDGGNHIVTPPIRRQGIVHVRTISVIRVWCGHCARIWTSTRSICDVRA